MQAHTIASTIAYVARSLVPGMVSDGVASAAAPVRMMSAGASEPSKWAVVRTSSGQLPVYRCVVGPPEHDFLRLLALGGMAPRVLTSEPLAGTSGTITRASLP